MFSSSPVRGTASSRLAPGGEHPFESAEEEATNPRQEGENNAQAVQGDKEEESQGLDADDMFPSSPV